jgi:cytochrome c551
MSPRTVILLLGMVLLLPGCSKTYTPAPNATGQQIFQQACAECHKAEHKETPGMIFILAPEQANVAFIGETLHRRSLLMPEFPNIKDAQLQILSEYVLNHSIIKK